MNQGEEEKGQAHVEEVVEIDTDACPGHDVGNAECGEDASIGIAEVLVVQLVIVCAGACNLGRGSVHVGSPDGVPEELEERPGGQADARHNSSSPAALLLEPQIKPFVDLFPGHLAIHSHSAHLCMLHVHHVMMIFVVVVSFSHFFHGFNGTGITTVSGNGVLDCIINLGLATWIVRDEIAKVGHLI